MALIPIVPEILIDMLEAPVPLLAGISKKEYYFARANMLTKEEMHSRIWINADENKVDFFGNYVPLFSFGDLYQHLKDDWDNLKSKIRKLKSLQRKEAKVESLTSESHSSFIAGQSVALDDLSREIRAITIKICNKVHGSIVKSVLRPISSWTKKVRQGELMPSDIVEVVGR